MMGTYRKQFTTSENKMLKNILECVLYFLRSIGFFVNIQEVVQNQITFTLILLYRHTAPV